jgi:hypothetical protein
MINVTILKQNISYPLSKTLQDFPQERENA